ncbi:Polynucleotide 5'-hydroxyl-kinase nol9 [Chytriomyces hyalinus]|nr:Polynucleotide 5'-hydroxyl-kinase nol9 [Chytriomyces hyalinus]
MKKAAPTTPSVTGNQFSALRKIKRSKSDPAEASSPANTAKRARQEEQVLEEADRIIASHSPKPKKSAEPLRRLFEPVYGAVVNSEEHAISLIGLKMGEFAPFQGAALVCAVKGAVSIAGAVLVASEDKLQPSFLPCFSPKSSSFLVIESVPIPSASALNASSSSNHDNHAVGFRISDVIATLMNKLTKCGDVFDTILAVKSIESSGIFSIGKRAPLFKDLFKLTVLSELNRDARVNIEGFNLVTEPNHPHSILSIPPSWTDATNQILEAPPSPVVCIIGSKGLGKSTLSKHTVNRLLSKYTQVAFLDCDLGQPEFTVSGQVSLHVLRDPILGPAFTHIKQPLQSCYLGATSPKNDPDWYISCIVELWRVYLAKVGRAVPLVINTDGWVKGMGFDLLVHALKQIRPSHVLQLGVDSMSSAAIAKNIRDDLAVILHTPDQPASQVQIINAEGFDESLQRGSSKYNAQDLRSLAMISYFAQYSNVDSSARICITDAGYKCPPIWKFSSSIISRTPVSVPWNAVKLRFLSVEVPFSQSLVALNGTLVGLVEGSTPYETTKTTSDAETEPTDLKIIPSGIQIPPQSQNCVGLGIVRGIDPVSKLFYIITPVPLEQLKRVNLILRGPGVEFPASIWTDGFENVRSAVPYITYTAAEGVGAIAKRPRSNLLRKKNI